MKPLLPRIHPENLSGLFLILLIFGFIFACSGSESSGKKENQESGTSYAAQSAFGPSGGVLEITDRESTLYGVSVKIPEGAVTAEKKITISFPESIPSLPSNYIPASSAVDFGPDGAVFNLPIEITLPYKDADGDGKIDGTYLSETGIGVSYYNDTKKTWEKIPIIGQDTVKNEVTVATSHFTLFLVYADPVEQNDDGDTDGKILLPGEYFLGDPEFLGGVLIKKGCINRKGMPCGNPYYLTVRYFDDIKPTAVIDRWPTTNTGPEGLIDDDGMAVTFAADQLFEKVLRSGSAALWQWECEFDTHTHLINFNVLDDEDVTSVNGIYPEIGVLENGRVRISWGFDLYTYFSVGDQIVIAFESYYK